jgi:hypothetical protein
MYYNLKRSSYASLNYLGGLRNIPHKGKRVNHHPQHSPLRSGRASAFDAELASGCKKHPVCFTEINTKLGRNIFIPKPQIVLKCPIQSAN